MGLDMYLEAEKYVSGYTFYEDADERRAQYDAVLNAVDALDFPDHNTPSATVRVNVAYWRKANAIHAWFVNTLADGRDECQDIYVPRESLESLLGLVRLALASPERAGNILPTQSGFFFGSTEYGEWYMNDLRDTEKILERVLETVPEDWDFYYRASW